MGCKNISDQASYKIHQHTLTYWEMYNDMSYHCYTEDGNCLNISRYNLYWIYKEEEAVPTRTLHLQKGRSIIFVMI